MGQPEAPNGSHSQHIEPIIVSEDIHAMVARALEAIRIYNEKDRRIFRNGKRLVRVELIENAEDHRIRPILNDFTPKNLRGELTRVARWIKVTPVRGGPPRNELTVPSKILMEEMLENVHTYEDIPIVAGVVSCPVFGANGDLKTEVGYSEDSRRYYFPIGDMKINPVPLHPTKEQIDYAVSILKDHVFVDFPFEYRNTGMAHAIGLLITMVTRDVFNGLIPAHLADSPTPGTGKTLILRIIIRIVEGIEPLMHGVPDNEAEVEKRITAALRTGKSYIFWDNLTDLDSAALARFLTSSQWGGRLLGKSEELDLSSGSIVKLATGNNVPLHREMPRRLNQIRLDAGVERPSERTGFNKTCPFNNENCIKDEADPNLLCKENIDDWALAHRSEILHAVYVIVRGWINAGKPMFSGNPLAGFEKWSRTVGGILEFVGIRGFLENREALYDSVKIDDSLEAEFVYRWWDAFKDSIVTARELHTEFSNAIKYPNLVTYIGTFDQFVKKLAKMHGVIHGGFAVRKVKMEDPRKGQPYRLMRRENPSE